MMSMRWSGFLIYINLGGPTVDLLCGFVTGIDGSCGCKLGPSPVSACALITRAPEQAYLGAEQDP